MLAALSIQNIVLIEKLDLEFNKGLTALTGETGAGKSILLDALGMALGARGDARLVRSGQEKGQVTALFELPGEHPALQVLQQNEIDTDGELVVRRIQSKDGRSRAFVNDVPVSISLLGQLSQLLVEIHGQHDDRALADISTHRTLLDAYGRLHKELAAVSASHGAMKQAQNQLDKHKANIDKIRERAGYLAHVMEELRALDPQPKEEEQLAGRRQMMMSAEKIAKDLNSADKALSSRGGLKELATILRKLERQPAGAGPLVQPVTKAIEKILLEVSEAQNTIYEAMRKCSFQPRDLDEAEERLFALREASRKYKVPVDMLPELLEKIGRELAALDADEEQLVVLQQKLDEAISDYQRKAGKLSEKRARAAKALDKAVSAELAPLKLDKARFITVMSSDESKGGVTGYDQIIFHVKTNPGSEPGPLLQVASGGELSRFILALKVVLAARGAAPVLIFDEIDKGVGGATASAIGERLSRLADNLQVFSVTHAPQVAALADSHLLISKANSKSGKTEKTVTSVKALTMDERREEIARMLAGSRVTKEARAAADRLMRIEA